MIPQTHEDWAVEANNYFSKGLKTGDAQRKSALLAQANYSMQRATYLLLLGSIITGEWPR